MDGIRLQPRTFTAKLLEKKLYEPHVEDVVALKVEVYGYKGHTRIRHTYTLVDFYDEKSGVTAMARTTAYTASAVPKLVLEGIIRLKGVVPPERLGMNGEIYRHIINELDGRGIKINAETFVE
ncbi:MAG: saccharopine dehydrogenase C-terminal domain-containing protein [Candidatus Bathyarchaeia archaeon]